MQIDPNMRTYGVWPSIWSDSRTNKSPGWTLQSLQSPGVTDLYRGPVVHWFKDSGHQTGKDMSDMDFFWCNMNVKLFGKKSLGVILPVQFMPPFNCLTKEYWTSISVQFSKHRPSGPMLFISQNVRLSVSPSIRPSVCVFTFELPFKRLVAPSCRGRMSNIFRDSESLGKSNKKKCCQIGTFLFGNGLKSSNKKKKVFFGLILPYKTRCKPRFPMD